VQRIAVILGGFNT